MAKDKMKLSDLKRYLNPLSKDELVNEVAVLFGKLDSVRDYYQAKLDPAGEEQLVAKYKAIIKKEFFPARGFGKLNLSTAKKAIADCRKLCRHPASSIDVMLFYVEQGVKFINFYGDIKESFYVSGETVFEDAVKLIVEHELQAMFHDRCRKIVTRSSDSGYGFHDQLGYVYRTYLS
jgi:hypothetical protein